MIIPPVIVNKSNVSSRIFDTLRTLDSSKSLMCANIRPETAK